MPPTVTVEETPGVEFEKSRVLVTVSPGTILPRLCGKGVPTVDPSLAEINKALSAGKLPIFWIMIVARTFDGLVRWSDELTTNLTMLHGVGPAVKLKLAVPRLVAPSCSWRVAVIVCPGDNPGSAVKVKSAPLLAPGESPPKL